jgi:hypothetical protein
MKIKKNTFSSLVLELFFPSIANCRKLKIQKNPKIDFPYCIVIPFDSLERIVDYLMQTLVMDFLLVKMIDIYSIFILLIFLLYNILFKKIPLKFKCNLSNVIQQKLMNLQFHL